MTYLDFMNYLDEKCQSRAALRSFASSLADLRQQFLVCPSVPPGAENSLAAFEAWILLEIEKPFPPPNSLGLSVSPYGESCDPTS